MFTSIGLTISGLLFISFIAIIYFQKKKYKNAENQIYRFLLILTIFLLLLELVCVHFMAIRDKTPFITEILCRGYILGDVVWFVTMYCYLLCISSDVTYTTIQELFSRLVVKFIILFSGAAYIVSCTLNVTYTSGVNNDIYVIGGPAVTILMVGFVFVALYMLKAIFHNLNRETFFKRIPIILFLFILLVLTLVQYLFIDLNELTFLFAYCVVAMYFTLENQDQKLVDELESAKKVAEIADRDKTTFLSKMSHEIRTPMNVIMGYSEFLINKEDVNVDEIKRDSKKIYNASKNLLEIVNNILIYSRIESGKEKVDETNYSILDVVGEVESYARSRIDSPDLRFTVQLDKDLPVNYFGDRLKIYRIILSIVNNSIKYTDSGEIEVKISSTISENDIAKLHIFVKDTGDGIKSEDLEEIKRDISESMGEEKILLGSGLGITLTQKIVKMLNGTMEISSEYGVGTKVDIYVEQKVTNSLKYKDVKTETEDGNNIYFDCSKYRVLVVDDNKLNRIVMEKLLKPYNVQYDLLENGTECISRIKSGVQYDLVLLDHMMPELDGIETLRILKKTNITLPPIIAVTANVVTELKKIYIEEGFDGYLSKPVDIRELNKLMTKYFKNNNGGK